MYTKVVHYTTACACTYFSTQHLRLFATLACCGSEVRSVSRRGPYRTALGPWFSNVHVCLLAVCSGLGPSGPTCSPHDAAHIACVCGPLRPDSAIAWGGIHRRGMKLAPRLANGVLQPRGSEGASAYTSSITSKCQRVCLHFLGNEQVSTCSLSRKCKRACSCLLVTRGSVSAHAYTCSLSSTCERARSYTWPDMLLVWPGARARTARSRGETLARPPRRTVQRPFAAFPLECHDPCRGTACCTRSSNVSHGPALCQQAPS